MSEHGSTGSGPVAGSGATSSLEAKKLQLNLKVLQRHDASITEILDSTSHVVIYRYKPAQPPADNDSQYSAPDMQWIKTSMAGGMFLFKRSKAPHYGFFVLNRHGLENFSHFLEDEADLEITPEFIILKGAEEAEELKGIWIFEEDHRDRIGQKMLELSRLSKYGSSLSKSTSGLPMLVSNDSPGSTSSSKPLPSGQSISLDMLFGSALGGGGSFAAGDYNDSTSHNQYTQEANSSNLWDGLGQAQATGLASSPSRENTDHQGVNLLESLFADVGNSATAKPSPTSSERLHSAQQSIITAAAADENALRTLLGLEATSGLTQQGRSQGMPSPSSYSQSLQQQHQQQQPQQQQNSLPPHLETLLQGASAQQRSLSQSQRPRPPAQLPQQAQAPVLEPLAPRPQRMAQFDSVGFETPPQPVPMSLQYSQSSQQQIQGHGYAQSSQASAGIEQHPMATRYQQGQPPPPPLPPPVNSQVQAQRPQQSFNSAPLMPSVILNKGGRSGSQVSPHAQQRTLPQQSQIQQPYGAPIYATQYANQPPAQQHQPQYSPSNSNFQGPMSPPPPPILRVKSPLRQSTTYYSSSEYSGSEPRFGAQSIPPPPVPVESRPNQNIVNTGQQRRNSGERGVAFSPRASPQRAQGQANPSPGTVDVLSDTLKRTGLYPAAPVRAAPGTAPQPIPIDRQAFRQHIFALIQDESFLEAMYQRYLDHLEGK